jgi:hypothetical protein
MAAAYLVEKCLPGFDWRSARRSVAKQLALAGKGGGSTGARKGRVKAAWVVYERGKSLVLLALPTRLLGASRLAPPGPPVGKASGVQIDRVDLSNSRGLIARASSHLVGQIKAKGRRCPDLLL